jgi:hypothetical protein
VRQWRAKGKSGACEDASLLHFGSVAPSMSALSRGSAIGDIDPWMWTATCSYCVLRRRRVLYDIAVEMRPRTRTQEDKGEWVRGHK